MAETITPISGDSRHATPHGLHVAEMIRSRRAAAVPHKLIESDETLVEPFADLQMYAAQFQERGGVEPVTFQATSLHLVSPENMKRVQRITGPSGWAKQDIGGLHDLFSNIMYATDTGERTPVQLIELWAIVSHELGHWLTPSLNFSEDPEVDVHNLREGTAEQFAQDFLHGVFLLKYFPEIGQRIDQGSTSPDLMYRVGSIMLKPRDISYKDAEGGMIRAADRLHEMRVIDALKHLLGPSEYRHHLRLAMVGTPDDVQRHITEQAGLDVWRLLTTSPDKKPPLEVAVELMPKRPLSRLG